jgi:hypothetical protein
MKRSLAVLFFLACPLLSAGADLKIAGGDKHAEHKLVRLTVEGQSEGAALLWDVQPSDRADLFREDETEAVFTGPPGEYRVRLLEIRLVDGKIRTRSTRRTVTIGIAPQPGPVPPAPVPPSPVPTAGLRVLFVLERQDKLTPGQVGALNSQKVIDYLNAKCVKDSDGRPAWRKWDKDVELAKELPVWQKLWEATKPVMGTLPQVVIVTDTKGETFNLPDSEQGMLDLLKKYGG